MIALITAVLWLLPIAMFCVALAQVRAMRTSGLNRPDRKELERLRQLKPDLLVLLYEHSEKGEPLAQAIITKLKETEK